MQKQRENERGAVRRMTLHISLVGRKDLSVEIYRQIRDAIVNRVLRPGDRIPATRELASTLRRIGERFIPKQA